MDGMEVINRIQRKLQTDTSFAKRFNVLVKKLNSIPGLQQEVIRIAKIDNPRIRQKAIDQLPEDVKNIVKEIVDSVR